MENRALYFSCLCSCNLGLNSKKPHVVRAEKRNGFEVTCLECEKKTQYYGEEELLNILKDGASNTVVENWLNSCVIRQMPL